MPPFSSAAAAAAAAVPVDVTSLHRDELTFQLTLTFVAGTTQPQLARSAAEHSLAETIRSYFLPVYGTLLPDVDVRVTKASSSSSSFSSPYSSSSSSSIFFSAPASASALYSSLSSSSSSSTSRSSSSSASSSSSSSPSAWTITPRPIPASTAEEFTSLVLASSSSPSSPSSHRVPQFQTGGITLTSPAYTSDDITALAWDTSTLSRAVASTFHTYEPRDLGGLRLRVGLVGEGRYFTIEALKNLACILALWEEVVDAIYRVDKCGQGNEAEGKRETEFPRAPASVRHESVLGTLDDAAAFDLLQAQADSGPLLELLQPRPSPLHPSSYPGDPHPAPPRWSIVPTGTEVTFYQLEPTRDPALVRFWCLLIRRIVEVAYEFVGRADELRDLLLVAEGEGEGEGGRDLVSFLVDVLRLQDEEEEEGVDGWKALAFWVVREVRLSLEKRDWGRKYLGVEEV